MSNSSDTVLIITALMGGLFGIIGLFIQSRTQVTVAKLTSRVKTSETAHEDLKAKVNSDAERSAQIVRDWQKNYAEAQATIGEVSAKYSTMVHDLDIARSKLDSVTGLSEQQKIQIDALQKQQEKNVSALKTAGETIASLTEGRNADHRTFEDTISRANDEHDRKQKELQAKIDSLSSDLKSANARIDNLVRQVADLESANQNMGFEISKLRTEVDQARAERDKAIKERDEARAELANLKSTAPAITVGAGLEVKPILDNPILGT